VAREPEREREEREEGVAEGVLPTTLCGKRQGSGCDQRHAQIACEGGERGPEGGDRDGAPRGTRARIAKPEHAEEREAQEGRVGPQMRARMKQRKAERDSECRDQAREARARGAARPQADGPRDAGRGESLRDARKREGRVTELGAEGEPPGQERRPFDERC